MASVWVCGKSLGSKFGDPVVSQFRLDIGYRMGEVQYCLSGFGSGWWLWRGSECGRGINWEMTLASSILQTALISNRT